MLIDDKLVLHVAKLANLTLSADEVTFYRTQLGRVLKFVDELSEVQDQLGSAWRADTLGTPTPECDDRAVVASLYEEALEQAPAKIGTAFQVPRILE